MCKEDIRIKRQTASRSVSVTPGIAFSDSLVPANPSRVSLVIGCSAGDPVAAGPAIIVRAGTATGDPILWVGNGTQPSVVLRIEDVGIPITGPLWVSDPSDSGVTWTITEVFFNQSLSDL